MIKSPGPSRLRPIGGISETGLLNYNLQKVRTNVLHTNIDSSITPTTLNHIGIGYPRFRNPNFSLGLDKGWMQPNVGKLGLRGLWFDLFPTVLFDTEGYARWGDDIASDNYFHTFTLLDTVTMIRGNHTGSAFFRDSIPGGRYSVCGAFVDDTWKLTKKLTLNLGFRWEPVVPHSDPLGRISYQDITAANPGAGNRLGAMRFGGSPDNGNRFLNNLWSNFAPRIGVAYRITERSVVRFGGGIYINSNYINHGLGSPVFGYSTTAAFTSPDGNRTAAFVWDGGFPQNFRRPPVKDITAANGQGATAVLPNQC